MSFDLIHSSLEELRGDELRAEIARLQRALVKEKDRTDQLVEAVYSAVKAGVTGIDYPPVPTPPRDRRTKGEEAAIVMLSDWQLGKRTPTYNRDVCAERVQRMADKVVAITDLQRADHPVKRCVVFLLGDIVEGELIFPGQPWHIDSSLFRQVSVDGPKILGDFLRTMLANFETVEVHAVPGNHGYLGGRARKDMHPESNADRMVYANTQNILDASGLDRLTWNVSMDWWAVAEVYPQVRFLLLHGDQVRGHNGVPWYGWQRKIQGWSMMQRIWEDFDFDYAAAGHFHTPVNIYVNGIDYWINGSTESHNPYALEQLAASGEPTQYLLFARPEGVTAQYKVSLV